VKIRDLWLKIQFGPRKDPGERLCEIAWRQAFDNWQQFSGETGDLVVPPEGLMQSTAHAIQGYCRAYGFPCPSQEEIKKAVSRKWEALQATHL